MDGNTTAAGSHHFIGNRWVASSTGQTIDVIDPSDGAPFAKIARGNAADVDAAVLAARGALGEFFDGAWGRMTATERGRLLMKLSYAVADHHDELARLESRTTGKPLKQGRADATALARYFEYYAGAADKLHGDTIPYQAGMTVLTLREPHGVTGHIVPWNYPMQIFGRSVGAALAAGNACVVKPAEDACLSVLRVAVLAAEVGFPAGALNVVTGYGAEAGAALAQHRGIDHISFTGSPVTGTAVAQAAAKHHCPVTLELGGKSPQIVFADANLDDVLPVVVNAIVQNAGQTCSAGSRLLIERPIYEELVARVGAAMSQLKVGSRTRRPGRGPVDPAKPAAACVGFFKPSTARQCSDRGARTRRRARAAERLLPGADAAARRSIESRAGAGRNFRAGACGDRLRFRRRNAVDRQRHDVRPGRRRLDARWRAPDASRAQAALRPGVHQQLRRGWRYRVAVRRREIERLRTRKGIRGAARVHHAQNHRDQARVAMLPLLERRFVQANRALLIVLLAAMVVVTFVNVVMRYAGESSFLWGEEVGRHLMIWLAFVGGGLALRNGAHIGVDSLERSLPPRAARIVRAAIALILLVLFVALMVEGIDYAWRTRFQASAALQISMAWVYAGMPIGCLLMLAHLGFIARRYVLGEPIEHEDGVDRELASAL